MAQEWRAEDREGEFQVTVQQLSQTALSCLAQTVHSRLSTLKPGAKAEMRKAKENVIKFTGQGKEIQY